MSTVNPLAFTGRIDGGGGGTAESVESDESPPQDDLPMIRPIHAPTLTQQEAEDNLNQVVNGIHRSHQMQLRLWTFILAVANAAGIRLSIYLSIYLSICSLLLHVSVQKVDYL